MHDLLASEYDMGQVAITKMRPKKQQHNDRDDDGRNIRHEPRETSPNQRHQTFVAGSGEKRIHKENQQSFDGRD